MEIALGFAKKKIAIDIEDNKVLGVLKPNEVLVRNTGADEVKRALEKPINSPRLKDVVKPREKVVIITSDITRPMPSSVVLPLVIEELNQAGVIDEDITVVFGLGSHRMHTESEKIYLVGEDIYKRVKCVDSDVEDCINLGKTSRGTPINVFRPVVECDRRICLGNIEYHYFAGYSGGAKSILPGVCDKETIQANHSMMVKEESKAGELEHNPLRNDIDEISKVIDLDFMVNVVLDEKKEIIKAVAGDIIEAHRAGCKFLDQLYKIELEKHADIVIVSPGGYPKDINLYQAQKALDNAKHAVREGGVIILLASCKEGFGSEIFEEWLKTAKEPEELISKIKENFKLGGHKAAAIAMVLQKCKVFLVSELEDEVVRKIFLEPYDSLQSALDGAKELLGADSNIIVMPYGGSTLPKVCNQISELETSTLRKPSFNL
ncbi:nickel-dependent lactate racemase family protein [Alkalibacter mobilis]|uniref:nickel-dependent lactate racemase n=1 Tax=Alkalibacter mobilis TaxID=2787712 RepID=UPI00189D12AF|nr:nickel-dependent lactate racemase [Alkalibacter mobilis]MBF7096739.1 nickel-dependent lactate racemase [Alkalibacter mobilis]